MNAKLIFTAAILAVTMGLLAVPQITPAVALDKAYAISADD